MRLIEGMALEVGTRVRSVVSGNLGTVEHKYNGYVDVRWDHSRVVSAVSFETIEYAPKGAE